MRDGVTLATKGLTVNREESELEIAKRMRAARKAAGLSQADVADALGITGGAYGKYETRSPIPVALLGPFCLVVGIEPNVILFGRSRQKAAALPRNDTSGSLGDDLSTSLKKSSAKQRGRPRKAVAVKPIQKNEEPNHHIADVTLVCSAATVESPLVNSNNDSHGRNDKQTSAEKVTDIPGAQAWLNERGFGYDLAAVRRMASSRKLPFRKGPDGKRLFVPISALEKFLKPDD